MKNVILQVLVLLLTCAMAAAQEPDHVRGGNFTKTITYNTTGFHRDGIRPTYNLEGKDIRDKIFFGLTNSPVEVTLVSFLGGNSGGFRLYKSYPDRRWRLEVIPFGNYEYEVCSIPDEIDRIEVPYRYLNWLKTGSTETPDIDTRIELFKEIPLSVHVKVSAQNKRADAARNDEKTYTSRRPETKIVVVDCLGEMLYERTAAFVDGFRAEGGISLIDDGYGVRFRCVIGDKLHTLSIGNPGGRAEKLSFFYMRMIDEMSKSVPFDEKKYIAELESIDIKPIAR